ncbi:hypothetical protein EYF80_050749 [Liparis tanakae]|uniref:Secreted protein n=1 Tax=Liparis tanakae TaxID=230148 RepID=A0A4Z2FDU8_9TELE|nr:hypothetical protein EYF80_050749 [Liparis tanakae]
MAHGSRKPRATVVILNWAYLGLTGYCSRHSSVSGSNTDGSSPLRQNRKVRVQTATPDSAATRTVRTLRLLSGYTMARQRSSAIRHKNMTLA